MASPVPAVYRPDIDGLRAVAVLAVIFFHADIGLSGGYVGVDIFFVISGFLITRILISEISAQKFSFASFLERRIRRILPALVFVVLATILACWGRLLPMDLENFGRSVVAQAALVANHWFYHVAGYFSPTAAQQPLLHTWSLAVEEQFYLLFPAALYLIHRLGIGFIKPSIVIAALASFALSVVWSYSHSWANFYFLPNRAWELLTGSLIAVAPVRFLASQRWREGAAMLGLICIVSAIFFFGPETRVPGLAALIPCGGAFCVISSGLSGPTLVAKLLSLPPLVFVGLISYSLYLWHWPLIALARYWEFVPITPLAWLGLLALCFALSVLTWKFIEVPFRQRRILRHRRQIFVFAASATLVLLSLGTVVIAFDGFPERIPLKARQFADGINDRVVLGPRIEGLTLQEARAGNWVELGGAPDKPIHLFVWGDSHAMAILPAIDALCKEHQLRGVAAVRAATPPLIDFDHTDPDGLKADAIPFGQAIIDFSTKHKIGHLILISNWQGSIHPKGPSAIERGLKSTLEALKQSGCKLWIMPSVPTYDWEVPRMLAHSVIHGKAISELGIPTSDFRRVLSEQLKLFGNADISKTLRVLDPLPYFESTNDHCLVQIGGRSLYRDSHHLSVHGARHLQPLFAPMFASNAR